MSSHNYIILRRWPASLVWEQVTAQYARNPESAVRQARAGNEEDQGDYLAIPVRFWKVIRHMETL